VRGATGWKLASYEVAGNVAAKLIRPERTMDAAVPSGRISFCDVNQTLRVWLISGCPVGTKAGATPKTATGTVALTSNDPMGGWTILDCAGRAERRRRFRADEEYN
jgi:hypothetical protein